MNKNIVASMFVVMLVVVLMLTFAANLGIGSFGPTLIQDVVVQRTYVDFSGTGDDKESHYMVGTDKGVFEVANGLLLGLWNSDELYAQMQSGKRYRITTKGKRVVGMFFQEYPYVVAVQPIPDGIAPSSTPVDMGRTIERDAEYVYDLRSNAVPLVVVLRDGTKVRYE